MPVVLRPRLLIRILPRQAQVDGDGGLVGSGRWRSDAGFAKGVVAGGPDDVACFVGGLQWGLQVVVVQVSKAVLVVLGFDEQGAGGEFAVGPRAVLGGDLGRATGADAAIGVQGDGLRAFGDQAFVGVQVVGALGWC